LSSDLTLVLWTAVGLRLPRADTEARRDAEARHREQGQAAGAEVEALRARVAALEDALAARNAEAEGPR